MALIRTSKAPIKKTVLWTNSAPTQNYSGGNVTVDFDAYDQFEIKYRASTSDASEGSIIVTADDLGASASNTVMPAIGYHISGTGDYSRSIYKTSTDIVVSNAYGGSGTFDPQYAIPLEVIGINF